MLSQETKCTLCILGRASKKIRFSEIKKKIRHKNIDIDIDFI